MEEVYKKGSNECAYAICNNSQNTAHLVLRNSWFLLWITAGVWKCLFVCDDIYIYIL